MIDNNDKYILVYAFGGSKNIKDLALNISHKTGYKILWINNTYKYHLDLKGEVVAWLSCFRLKNKKKIENATILQ